MSSIHANLTSILVEGLRNIILTNTTVKLSTCPNALLQYRQYVRKIGCRWDVRVAIKVNVQKKWPQEPQPEVKGKDMCNLIDYVNVADNAANSPLARLGYCEAWPRRRVVIILPGI